MQSSQETRKGPQWTDKWHQHCPDCRRLRSRSEGPDILVFKGQPKEAEWHRKELEKLQDSAPFHLRTLAWTPPGRRSHCPWPGLFSPLPDRSLDKAEGSPSTPISSKGVYFEEKSIKKKHIWRHSRHTCRGRDGLTRSEHNSSPIYTYFKWTQNVV